VRVSLYTLRLNEETSLGQLKLLQGQHVVGSCEARSHWNSEREFTIKNLWFLYQTINPFRGWAESFKYKLHDVKQYKNEVRDA